MSIRNRYMLAVCASILAFGFAACEKKGPAEKAGEKIDNAAEEVKEGVNEAADEVKDATN